MTLPEWLQQLDGAIPHVRGEHFTRFLPPAEGGRPSAVLVLFGEGPDGPDLLLIERAATLRSHAGQPAFPGGAQDPEDADPVAAALREAEEEVGVDPASVQVLGILPALWLPPSGFVVHPVVAWWHTPHPVRVVDEAEVAAVERVPLSELTDPENRFRVVHPSGFTGPAFQVRGMMVWGFTAGLLSGILALAGWERPWDTSRTQELDPETVRLAARTWQNKETP
ncbi:MAG TPA: CoA pyrophosphatase [Mycobacteriales bacterium]|nr:CoA pyrophosphatase [Mycobacteriales bacterium]